MTSPAAGAASTAAPAASPAELERFAGAGAGKIGMWIFLVTDGMGFGGLLIADGVLRVRAAAWPDPASRLAIPLAAAMTMVLLTSSLTVLLALAAARQGRPRAATGWLAATVGCGAAFLVAQGFEYAHLGGGAAALGLSDGAFASTFYVITGYHGLHVLAGIVYLGTLLVAGGLGARDGQPRDERTLEIAALYWHFVDLAWVPIFTFVYLLPAR